ncbi:hypothetical protein [Arthrobacter sp. NPDC058127]|uniref:hypothetical protein n=1 Tax=Arthrobacter sp. NPDC058127 TaxID=3346351 RepID=UPI0036EE5873
MTDEIWRPLGFDPEDRTTYDALHDGVPAWMEKSLESWLLEILESVLDDESGETGALRRFQKIERELRVSIRQPKGLEVSDLAKAVLSHFRYKSQSLVLTDFLLSKADIEKLGGAAAIAALLEDLHDDVGRLEALLRSSGSKWAVGIRTAGRLGLVQRVPEGVQRSVEHTIGNSGHAGVRLARAWESAFGVSPNPSLAYSLAVKAVEDAATPVVSPNDTTATLGKINSQMRNTGDWGLPLAREDEHATPSDTLLSMMKMLWAGQADRHGGHHDPSLVITQEAAEVAVITAATLVQWFTSGAVARR